MNESARTIQIIDAEGVPVAGALAVLISDYYTPLEGSGEDPLEADAEGRIVLTAHGPEDMDDLLLVWAPGHAATRGILAEGTTQVRLAPPVELRAQVDPRVDSIWIHGESEGAWPFFVRCEVGPRGRIFVAGLSAGTYSVAARPLGGAPVLHAAADGSVRYLAEEPGPLDAPAFRLLDREIVVDGSDHTLRTAFGESMMRGVVVDENERPIAGATVRVDENSVRTNAAGEFEAVVPPASHVFLRASHPDYGLQWTEYEVEGWIHNGPITRDPIRLQLRRGVVLHGTLVDESGGPSPYTRLILVPAYIGSGPATIEARTDSAGRFTFERALLRNFELVVGSLDNWHPRRAGRYLRVQDADQAAWVTSAAAGSGIAIRTQTYELVNVLTDVKRGDGSPLRNQRVHLWLRRSAHDVSGTPADTNAAGRVPVVMEVGRRHELWVVPAAPSDSLRAPWTQRPQPMWAGVVEGAMELDLEIP